MKFLTSSVLALLAAVLIAADANAITCYALTDGNHVITFDSATPGTILTDVPILNLPNGYTIVGMDMRITMQTLKPANAGIGSLWAVGTNGGNFRLFVINPTTGVATQQGNPFGAPDINPNDLVSNDAWSFAFNPGKDRFEFVGREFNFLVDPNTVDQVRMPNVFTVGAAKPALSGARFTTNSFGIPSQFYIVNAGENFNLCTSGNITAGGLISEVGAPQWGINLMATQPSSLSISYDLTLLAASDSKLYNVDRSTGIATLIGAFSAGTKIRSLIIQPASYPPVLPVTVAINGKRRITTTKASRVIKGTAACLAGIKFVQYKIGNRGFRLASGTTSWRFKAKLKIGRNKIFVQATGGNDVLSNLAMVKVIRK